MEQEELLIAPYMVEKVPAMQRMQLADEALAKVVDHVPLWHKLHVLAAVALMAVLYDPSKQEVQVELLEFVVYVPLGH